MFSPIWTNQRLGKFCSYACPCFLCDCEVQRKDKLLTASKNRIENAALYEFTLDLRDGGLKAGTDVVLSEIDDPDFPGDMLNQAWDVEYLGPI